METWQVNYIKENLMDLQNLTICNVQLLTFLIENYVLNQEEYEQLVSKF